MFPIVAHENTPNKNDATLCQDNLNPCIKNYACHDWSGYIGLCVAFGRKYLAQKPDINRCVRNAPTVTGFMYIRKFRLFLHHAFQVAIKLFLN